ncbi:leucyl-tRNA synthetase, mitochondrial [Fusarium austroafricanum]|uniref:leucine--tRNA ligase n=1 Tax=Fusarium austroafricanum TaxID=2364996 RepID=A0A8H4KKN8_9HYPO|nr:leucyl-tRNA synthetase, mitochondrial [Fusarium austroafricanum]
MTHPTVHGNGYHPMSCAAARRALSSLSVSKSIQRPIIAHPKTATLEALSRRSYAIDLTLIDKKWRKRWKESNEAGEASEKLADSPDKHFVLPMFPYPSGTLHLGHLRVYSIADVVARFRTLKGENVMLPMGWDAFGLPAENAAIERGVAPEKWTTSNMAKMKEQLEHMNGSWDWDRELSTCDPAFYKHTQKLFLMLHERGLAYQAEAEVNWDPVDKTVLANEQVDADGFSWRSGVKVEKRKLKQWFFRISEFREALLEELEALAKENAWPERVLAQQKNWLGKSTGVSVKFPVLAMGHDIHAAIEVFTTRPDTLFGVQYVALAASHPIVSKLAASDPELQAFIDTIPGLPADSKVGYLLPHLRAINPLAYHEETPDATKVSLPVYVAPYVLGDYGEGAVMGVPGHDLRDNAFWKEHHYDVPVRHVLSASEDESTTAMENEPFVEHGVMTKHSGFFKGKHSAAAGEEIVKLLENVDLAKSVEKWRLRDWLISRQRYWGTPIPIIHCDSCGPVPVPDDQLPVKLPEVDWAETRSGSPLEFAPEFANTTCPKCNSPARRDTDTMDTFVDSSWYYARFADPHNKEQLFSPEAGKTLPVDTYIGGIEHAILHLLYARFIFKFLASTDLLPQYTEKTYKSAEPFKRLITQGMVHGKTYIDPDNGRFLKHDEVDLTDPNQPKVVSSGKTANVSYEKMSKSKYNGVDPLEFISKYGADATRAHMLFQAPVGEVLNWDEAKISGVTRWLQRLHDQITVIAAEPVDKKTSARDYLAAKHERLGSASAKELAQWDAEGAIWRHLQRTITSVTASYEEVYSLNTLVSDLMILTNTLADNSAASPVVKREAAQALISMTAPITPAFAEECWALLNTSTSSIFQSSSFPVPDASLDELVRPRIQPCAVQVNGKVRGVVEIPPPPTELSGDELRDWMVKEILATEEGAARFSKGPYDLRSAKRAIPVRGGKTINFVLK